jgi:hypothetical protein
VYSNGQEISKSECFRYIGSIIHKDGEIENDMNRGTKVR